MGKRYSLDTNTIIDYLGGRFIDNSKVVLNEIIDKEINISVINKIELLSTFTVDEELIDFIKISSVYPLNDDIVDCTIDIRRKYKLKLPDAVIAATTLYHKFTLITNNTKDFKKVKGLKIVNPFKDF